MQNDFDLKYLEPEELYWVWRTSVWDFSRSQGDGVSVLNRLVKDENEFGVPFWGERDNSGSLLSYVIENKIIYLNKIPIIDIDENGEQFLINNEYELFPDKNLEKYIDQYLDLWLKGEIRFRNCNTLSSKLQIKKVATEIFEIYNKYQNKHIVISEIKECESENDGCDRLATLLYLESIGDIKLIDTRRAIIKDKFFEDFSWASNEILFDFEELRNSPNSPKIYFDGNTKLTCGDKTHRLQIDKFPYVFLNKSFDGGIIKWVSRGELMNEMGHELSQDLQKDIDNFRKSLRNRFDMKEESFVEVSNENIRLDRRIFKLKKG